MRYLSPSPHQHGRALLALGLLLALLLPASALAQSPGLVEGAELPLLVRLPDEVPPEQAPAYLAALGLEALDPIPRIHVWRARPLPGQPAALQTLRQNLADRVLWVEQDGLVYAQDVIPNDSDYAGYQWNLPLIGSEQAWHWSRGGQVLIAIIDSGIDLAHPDLQAQLWVNPGEIAGTTGLDDDGNGYVDDVHGWDFVANDALPQDEYGHGTHVAGIAGAQTDNGAGIAGVGWDVRLMAVRVLDPNGKGSWGDLAEGIGYAAENGARILNLSLGGFSYSQTVAEAIADARELGCLVIAAAGNSSGPIQYPARLEGVMAVAATNQLDTPAFSYSYGPEMAVAAPGIAVYSTYWVTPTVSSFTMMSGTSMATPHVSGLAALLWAYEPSLTAAQVTHIITSTAHDVYTPGWDARTGWGRINARAALAKLALPRLPYRYRFPLLSGVGP